MEPEPAPGASETTEGGLASGPTTGWPRVALLWGTAICLGLAAGILAAWLWWRAPETAPVSLQVTDTGGTLLIRWDRASDTVRRAHAATFAIRDQETQVELSCDRACLAGGSVSYVRRSEAVEIRMRLEMQRGGAVEEWTRFVLPQRPPEAMDGLGPAPNP